jgi:ribonuclease HI
MAMASPHNSEDREGDLFPSPSAGWTTAYCDGGSRGNPGPAGFGVLLQNGAGEVLGELSEYLGIRTNNFAEYSGLLAALEFALAHGHRRLRVVSDSELMVKQVRGQYRVNSPELRLLHDKAKTLICQLDRFEIRHVLREKNRDADRLANQAMDRGTDRGMGRRPAPESQARGGRPQPRPSGKASESMESESKPGGAKMLRGFIQGGVVHLLGSELPDGTFVKVILEESS